MRKTIILFFIFLVPMFSVIRAQTVLLNEGFEEGGTFPSTWQGGGAYNSAGSSLWMESTSNSIVNSNVNVYAGTYMAALWDGCCTTVTTNLITPAVNLTGYTSAQLTFHYIVCTYFAPAFYDSLYVYYFIGSNGTPHLLPIPGYTQVTSNADPQWDSATISLPVGSDSVFVEFSGVDNQDNGIFIDNVTITGARATAISNVNENKNATIAYPNPTTGMVELTGLNNSCKSIKVYNLLGEQVQVLNNNSNTAQMDLSRYPNGIYLYKEVDGNGNVLYQDKVILKK